MPQHLMTEYTRKFEIFSNKNFLHKPPRWESAKQAPPSELAVLVIADPGFKELLQKIGTNFDNLFGKVIEYAGQYKVLPI